MPLSMHNMRSKLPTFTAFRARRTGVTAGSEGGDAPSVQSAVGLHPVHDQNGIVSCRLTSNLWLSCPQVYPKSPSQQDLIRKGITSSPLFHNFEEALLLEIIDSLEPYNVKAGTEVITQVRPDVRERWREISGLSVEA
jgi:hypothetical protein